MGAVTLAQLRIKCPTSVVTTIVPWALQAIKLEVAQQDLWLVHGRMRHFDDQLSVKLRELVQPVPALRRRCDHLEATALALGQTLPSRKNP